MTWKDSLIRGTVAVTLMNIAAAVLNYFVHPLAGRALSVSEYGDFQALLSLLAIFTVLGTVYFTLFTKAIAPFRDDCVRVGAMYRFGRRNAKRLGSVFFVVSLLSIPFLQDIFSFSSPLVLLILSLSVFFLFDVFLTRAVLSGTHRFVSYAINTVIEPFARFAAVFLFVTVFAWGAIGSTLSLVIGLVSVWAFGLVQTRFLGAATEEEKIALTRAQIPFVFVITLLTQLFFNVDMLFVKWLFSSETAGMYGAILTIGRIVFYVGFSISSIVLPMVSGLNRAQRKAQLDVLRKALLFCVVCTLPVVVFVVLEPGWLIQMLLGVKYVQGAALLPLMAIAMFALAILSILAQYVLATNDQRGMWILSVGFLTELILLAAFHANLAQVIMGMIVAFTVTLVACTVSIHLFRFSYDRSAHHEEKT